MATLQFKRGTAFIDPEIGEPFLDTSTNALKIGIGGNDFITILDSGSLNNATSVFNSRLDSIELTTASLNTSVSNLNSFTQSFNTAISLDSSNVTILGNLDVQGTTTTIDSTTITLGDNIIELNGTGASNGGILVNDVTNPNTLSGSLLWDGTNDYWKAGQLGSENEIITTANIVSNLPDGIKSGSSQVIFNDISQNPFESDSNGITASNHFVPSTTEIYDLGSETFRWRSLYLSGSTIDLGGTLISVNDEGNVLFLDSASQETKTAVVDYSSITSLPTLLSGSSQVDVTQTTNYSSINQYSDTKVKTKLDVEGVISSSAQITITESQISDLDHYTDSDTQVYIDSIGLVSGSITEQLPSGVVSGSSQIDHDQTTNYSSDEHFTQENITTLGTVTSGNVDSILPSGVVSGSSQIDVTQTTNYSSINQYSDTKVKTKLNVEGVISGSSQITITESQISDLDHYTDSDTQAYIDSIGLVSGSVTEQLPLGVVSGSSQVDVTQTTNYSSINQYTDSDFDTRFGTKSTTDLSEGTNKYYTDSKVKTKLDVEGVISGSSQVDVTQTTNYSSINQYTDSDTQNYIDSIGLISGSVSGQLPSGTVSGSSQIDHDQTLNFSADEHFTQGNITTLGTVTVGSVTAILPSGTVSGSSQINITGGLPSGTVSGSEQIDHDLTLNFSPAEHYTQENITTVGTVTTGNIDGILPSGTVSGSVQVDVTQTTNYSSINQYTDSDTQNYIDSIGLVSGSVSGQLPSGTVSGSSQIDVTQTTNYSSIEQYTDSDNQSYIDSIGLLSGSSQVNMGGDISGDATNATVEKVQGVSLTSGEATQLANIDTHTISNTQWGYLGVMNQNVRTTDNVTFNTGSFTGDVTINGNFTVLGSATEIATTELTVEDKLITIASGSADSAAADGAGIFIDGANESITWNHSNSRFNISDDLNVEGNVTVTGDVVAFSSSDRRFKDNLTKIVTPLSKLSQINGYTFNWNTDKQYIYKGKDYGVVAQEIQEVLPELVQERENGYLAVNYEKLVPLLIESIKELKTQVDHLNKKLEK